jgi:hypothetical protein
MVELEDQVLLLAQMVAILRLAQLLPMAEVVVEQMFLQISTVCLEALEEAVL